MKTKRISSTILLTLTLGLLIFSPALASKGDGKNYEVTITNLTKKQVMTPPILISHRSSYELFSLAQPVGAELATLAEGGDSQALAALLGTHDDVHDVVTSAVPILPGSSITLTINSKGRFNRLSLAGMLATSNDGFFALNGVKFPHEYSRSRFAVAYDAGSEVNTELCSDLPGPPCAADSGNQRITTDAEGFVHIHNGIHGTGDLNAANMDWQNPVAKVVIERVK